MILKTVNFYFVLHFLFFCYGEEFKDQNPDVVSKWWIDKVYKFGTSSRGKLVKLNVGGKIYETTIDTLTKANNTFFTSLFANPWEINLDDEGRIFLDRNGNIFSYILDYMRTGELVMPEERYRGLMIAEIELYHLTVSYNFQHGNLLNFRQQYTLNKFYGVTNQQWKLLYKATQHGFSALAFHNHCDNKGPTMTIVKSTNGYLFGGFTKKSWGSDVGYKTDPAAFIFTLTNPHGIAATKFILKHENIKYAMCAHTVYGPVFGGHEKGHDIHNFDNRGHGHFRFPSAYVDTTDIGTTLFTGTTDFATSEIEVYGLA